MLRGWRDLNAIAPRAATFTAWVGESQSPVLPPEWRERPVASVGFVWAGEPELDRQLLPALRALGRPVAERVEELSYLELQRMEDTLEGHAAPLLEGPLLPVAAGRGDRRVPAARHARRPRRAAAASLQAYGGAIAEVPDADSAFSQRDAMFEFVAAARWSDAAEDEQRMSAARRYAASLEPFASGMYVNAMSDEGSGRRGARVLARQARPPQGPQGRLRPRQRLPPQPEHRTKKRIG